MFWGKKKEDTPAKIRHRQIDELKINNPSAVHVPGAIETYQLALTTVYGQLKFNIYLPPSFPEKPPSIVLLARVQHKWVDKEMRVVGHPKLASWTPHTNIGQLVRDIYHEFARNPPSPIKSSQVPVGTVLQQPGSSNSNPPLQPPGVGASAYPYNQQQQSQSANNFPSPHPDFKQNHQPNSAAAGAAAGAAGAGAAGAGAPPPYSVKPPNQPVVAPVPKCNRPQLPSSFSAIESLGLDNLKALLNNPDTLTEMAKEDEGYRKLLGVKTELVNTVETLAKANLAHRRVIEEAENNATVIMHEMAANKKELQTLRERQKKACEKFSFESIISALDAAIAKQEAIADDLKYAFRKQCDALSDDDSGDDSDDDDGAEKAKKPKKMKFPQYTKKYLAARQKAHLLIAKRERFTDMFQLES